MLAVYLVCEPETPELAQAAVEGGADLVELGFPFSDPLAEGPTIRLASERALSRGMRTAQCLECLAETRRRVEVPLVPMTYAAILEAYGYDRSRTRMRPTPAEIGRLDATLPWLFLIENGQQRLAVIGVAMGLNLRVIGRTFGCSHETVRQRERAGIEALVQVLNGRR